MGIPENKMLIVYEENPEAIKFYLIESDHKIANAIECLSGKLLGTQDMTPEEEKIAIKLSKWMASDNGQACLVQLPLSGVRITRVVHTGFIM